MLNDAKVQNVYLATGATDLRRGIDSLSALIQSQFGMDPFASNTLFLFCGRRSDRIKGLLWEGDGFLLLTKRLEAGRYQWPRTRQEALSITPEQFTWLMQGLSIVQKQSIQRISPSHSL